MRRRKLASPRSAPNSVSRRRRQPRARCRHPPTLRPQPRSPVPPRAESPRMRLNNRLTTRRAQTTVASPAVVGVVILAWTSGKPPYLEGDEIGGDGVPMDTTSDCIAVPLSLGSQLGVVEVGGGEWRTFERNDHDLLRLLADRASGIVEQARLEDAGRRS